MSEEDRIFDNLLVRFILIWKLGATIIMSHVTAIAVILIVAQDMPFLSAAFRSSLTQGAIMAADLLVPICLVFGCTLLGYGTLSLFESVLMSILSLLRNVNYKENSE